MAELPPHNHPPKLPPQRRTSRSAATDGATISRPRVRITADDAAGSDTSVAQVRRTQLVIDATGNEVATPRKPRASRATTASTALTGDPNATQPPPPKPSRKKPSPVDATLPTALFTVPPTTQYTPLASSPNHAITGQLAAQQSQRISHPQPSTGSDPNATISSNGSWPGNQSFNRNNSSNGQSRALQIPQTITLPTNLTNPSMRITQPVAPDSAKMHIAQKSSSLTSHPIVVIPGGTQLDTTLRVAPSLHHTAKVRSHRNVLIGLLLIVVVFALSFVPLSRALGAQTKWLAAANGLALPTITPTPAPLYAEHPVVGGSYNFICTALPFARLANQRMVEAGMSHPWYVSTILAQWGVEFGWSMPSYTGYNFGNVSGIPGYPAVGGINVPGSPSSFAYAYTPLQGVEYYVIFVQNGYYNNVADAYPRGPIAQALAIGASPWDADHYNLGGQWGGKITSAMQTFDLTRFDNPNLQC